MAALKPLFSAALVVVGVLALSLLPVLAADLPDGVVLDDGSIDCWRMRIENVKSGATKLNGVNVGSWLVFAKYGSEYMFVNATNLDTQIELEGFLANQSYGAEVLNNFFATAITEYDFAKMSHFGLNAIRLPIPWWIIFNGTTPVSDLGNHTIPGALNFLDKAMDWSLKYGLAVLLDLHMIDGQEIADSGYIDPAKTNNTLYALQKLVDRYHAHPALYGFGLINEPAVPDYTALDDYYERGYRIIRDGCPLCWVVISVFGYPNPVGAPKLLSPAYGNYSRTVMDFHLYIGGDLNFASISEGIDYLNGEQFLGNWTEGFDNANNGSLGKRMLIGEWSMNNGFGASDAENYDLLNAQLNAFRTASAGFTFWHWTYNPYPNHIDYMSSWSLQTYFQNNHLPRENITAFTDPCPSIQQGSRCVVQNSRGDANPFDYSSTQGRCQVCSGTSSTGSSGMEYLGCFPDDWSQGNDLIVFVGRNLNLTHQVCADACKGYNYFGVEWGNNCFCGDTFGRFGQVNETFCSLPCSSNSSQICGGYYYLSIFKRTSSDVAGCVNVLSADKKSNAHATSAALSMTGLVSMVVLSALVF